MIWTVGFFCHMQGVLKIVTENVYKKYRIIYVQIKDI